MTDAPSIIIQPLAQPRFTLTISDKKRTLNLALGQLNGVSTPSGEPGFSAYQLAVKNGFVGSEQQWLVSLIGERGLSAYELAALNGFQGAESDWLISLVGQDGSSAWTPLLAVESDGDRRVIRITEWTGGTGAAPATGYIGASGLVATASEASDIRGAQGAQGAQGVSASDWQTVVLSGDFSTSSTSAVAIPQFEFTPADNAVYEVEAFLLARTTATTNGARPSVTWPDGTIDGTVMFESAGSVSGRNFYHGGAVAGATTLASFGDTLGTSTSSGQTMRALFVTGSGPITALKMNLQSEAVSPASVTIKAGSVMRWRRIL